MKKLLKGLGIAFAFATCTQTALAQDATITPDPKRGELLFTQGDVNRGVIPCFSCHGEGGNSVIATQPSLAGHPAGYIVAQLNNLDLTPEGTQKHRNNYEGFTNSMVMMAVAPALTPQDRADIAAYVSGLKLTGPAKSQNAGDLEFVHRGREIWRAGIPDRGVPACAACHGVSGKGMPEQYPFLAGQHPEYLYGQLRAFADGYRNNGGTENMMGTIANRMSIADMKAVADYAAGLR